MVKFNKKELVELRVEAERDFWVFCTEVIGFPHLYEPLHKPLCYEISHDPCMNCGTYHLTTETKWACCKKPKAPRYKLILVPRGHFKTTIATQAATIWETMGLPSLKTLLSHANKTTSIANLRWIKDQCEENDILKAIAPDIIWNDPSKETPAGGWRESQIIMRAPEGYRDYKVPTVMATGVDASVVGYHFHRKRLDDLVTDDNCYTQDGREKVRMHIRNLQATDRGRTAKTIIIGTRWHYDDAYSDMLDPEGPFKGQIHIIDKFASCWVDDDEEKGEPIFGQVEDDSGMVMGWTHEDLLLARETMGSSQFNAHYRNNPTPEGERLFSKDDIDWFDLPSMPMDRTYAYYTSVDPCHKERAKKSDDAVVMTGAMDEFGHLWIVEISSGKCSGLQLIEWIENHVRKYNPKLVGVESNGFQEQLITWQRHQMLQKEMVYRIQPLERSRANKKIERIKALQPIVEAKGLHVARQYAELGNQLEFFPNYKNDDLADALADIYKMAKAPKKVRKLPKRELPKSGILMGDLIEGRQDRSDAAFAGPGRIRW